MAKKKDDGDNLFCSFCGKNQSEVRKLIAGLEGVLPMTPGQPST